MSDGVYLSVVLPVYNDAAALDVFLPELLAFVGQVSGRHEVVVVDDGGADALLDVFEKYAKQMPDRVVLRLIKLSRNFGKEAALTAGLKATQGRVVAMLDADGQHPISVLEEMLALYRSGVEMVAGVQSKRDQETRVSRFLKKGFYHFIQDSRRYKIKANAGDFRLMDRKVVDAILALPERQRFMKGLYAWVGFRTAYVPFTADTRNVGTSKFNYAGLFELAMTGITSFSQKPLRLIARMGMLVSLCALLYGLYVVFYTLLFGKDTPGWATIVVGLMFSSGVQLICLGLIGEYIGRIYEEVKQRPLYIVDQVLSSDKTNEYSSDEKNQ